jgi:uncharacterized protein YkwD
MKTALQVWAVCAALIAPGLIAPAFAFAQAQYNPDGQYTNGVDVQAEANQLFALANQARWAAGVGQLQWDQSLAAAAFYHCKWMVQAGAISHRFAGEPDLKERAADRGARFATVEENVAEGTTAVVIQDAWMKSPGHRANLLSPVVDRVGIAVIASRGMLYAVEDFAHEVPSLTDQQVEARVADLVRVSGIGIEDDPTTARAACATDSGFPRNAAGVEPRFIERWQNADLDKLPRTLVDHLSSGKYRSAAIGSCPAQVSEGSFTAYRIAVLLY